MRKPLLSGVMVAALTFATAADAQGPLRKMMMKRWMERQQQQQQSGPAGTDIAYGSDPLQHLDFWRATRKDGAAPLVIFVHGGGWEKGDKEMARGSAKVSHSLERGYAFASVGYRLVPSATVEQQAQDVADAIAVLVRQAATLGIDSRRIVLMGHSAGAHLAALVGTDPHYLDHAHLHPDALKGVILLDGAAYDVPRQIAEGGTFMHDRYLEAFGSDPARQKALSPTFHAAAPNVPSFLILHVARADGTAQSEQLGEVLRKAGTPAEVQGFAGSGLKGHMAINRQLCEKDYPATPVVDAYLDRVFA